MLAKAFKRNSSIKGIYVDQEEIKISQYADDTTLILNGSQASLSAALNRHSTILEKLRASNSTVKKQKQFGSEQIVEKQKFFFQKEILDGKQTK